MLGVWDGTIGVEGESSIVPVLKKQSRGVCATNMY